MGLRYDFFTLCFFFKSRRKVFYMIDQSPGVFWSQRIFPSWHRSTGYPFYNSAVQIFITGKGSRRSGAEFENSFTKIPWPRVKIFSCISATITIFSMAEHAHMHKDITTPSQKGFAVQIFGFGHSHIVMRALGSKNTAIAFAVVHMAMIHFVRFGAIFIT